MKTILKHKAGILRTIVLGGSLLVFSASSALAANDTPVSNSTSVSSDIASHAVQEIPAALLEKQRAIDEYLAGEGAAELKARGFAWTFTGISEKEVQIGITPYSDENAQFLYDKFGTDQILVVESEQPQLMIAPDHQGGGSSSSMGSVGSAGPAGSADSIGMREDPGTLNDQTMEPAILIANDEQLVYAQDGAEEARELMATTQAAVQDSLASDDTAASTPGMNPLYYVLGGLAIVGGLVALLRKKLSKQ